MSESLWDSDLEDIARAIFHELNQDGYGESDWSAATFEMQGRYMQAAKRARDKVRGW